jgi:hypothetical protein
VFKPEPVEQAVRIPSARFAPGGLAYDAVSRRFVLGDRHGRKLMIVSEGSDHAVDLVRADSAGFHEIRAIEIDSRRGDLWAATATPAGSDWTVHRMQLVSGRPLKAIAVATDLEPVRLIDLAVSPAGAVLALDAIGSRLLVLGPGDASLMPLPRMDVQDPTSVAVTSDEGIVYVAHRGGVSRVDLKSGAAAILSAPRGLELGLIERLRWYRNSLLAVQIDADRTRRVLRFDLNASGRAVTAATIIDASIPSAAGPTFATVSGDELSYVVADADPSVESSLDGVPGRLAEFIVRRIRLH